MNAKTVCSICILTVALALGAIPGWAQLPPQSGVSGSTAGRDFITSTALDQLATAVVRIPNTGSAWHCAATCSVEARLFVADNGITVHGRLALIRSVPVGTPALEVGGTSRRFELTDNAGVNDADSIEVSTTGLVPNLPAGSHSLSCAAAKIKPFPEEQIFKINRSSITVSCSDFRF